VEFINEGGIIDINNGRFTVGAIVLEKIDEKNYIKQELDHVKFLTPLKATPS
jgi:hypothetical protein